MEEQLRNAISEALEKAGASGTVFAVEWPADISHGDYATNAAMAAAKTLGRNPRELADALAQTLRESLAGVVSSIEVAGPGFINFTLARPVISGIVKEAATLGSDWGRGSETEGKRYSIEYSCPNPFKEMHIGHLMSTVIGEALAGTIENGGATVIRDSYGGDVGPHVAKALWALREKGIAEPATAKEIGDAYAHGSRAYEESAEAKTEIDGLNRAIYQGTDAELMELWRKGRDVSLEAFREIYKVLSTHFDYYFFESETATPGMEVVQDGLARGIFEESEGAIIYKGEKKGLHTLVFVTSQGTPTYEAKELGLAFLIEERVPNDIRYILTAAEQVGHFAVVHAAMEDIAPLVARKTSHVPHGFLRLTSGKMSSREGNIITAAALIEEVLEKAKEKNEDPLIAEQVAVGAIKYMILRQAAGGDIMFDTEKSLSLDGDSGPYLQYALVRARSILAQASEGKDGTDAPDAPYTLERLLIRFPEVAALAVRDRTPHKITQYLTQLAGEWNSFYAQERIRDGEYEGYKRAVAKTFVTTMENGLRILAIPAPERM
jgi:arginyl-tRNA synthetase